MQQTFSEYKQEFTRELINIADWWIDYAVDDRNGGFYGEIDDLCRPNHAAHKSLVLNARILWFFSEAAQLLDDVRYHKAADRAFDYLNKHFQDPLHGGYWWHVDHLGNPSATRKQVYGQAFVIYAFCSYHSLTGDSFALDQARELFTLIERHAVDQEQGGYLEAFCEQWRPIDDLRLSEKDLNHPKTMNTHLHVLEAYTSLQRICPAPETREALIRILGHFRDHIINGSNFHLRMFLDNQWNDHSTAYSYGHDIEASWLLWEALEVLNQPALMAEYRPLVLGLAESCKQEALSSNGGILDEYEFNQDQANPVYPWWVQAEALVGFFNAYQLSGSQEYLTIFAGIWSFIKDHTIDPEFGEWLWLSRLCEPSQQQPAGHYKAGSWKGPYHNGRAMIEIHNRLNHLIETLNKTPEQAVR